MDQFEKIINECKKRMEVNKSREEAIRAKNVEKSLTTQAVNAILER